jgi:RNA polymerase sigma factor for flagellar operon FliA
VLTVLGMEITTVGTKGCKSTVTARIPSKNPCRKLAPAIARRNAYATKHHALVGKIARRMARKLPSYVEMDDLISAGMMGLLDAADRFDPDRGEKFEAFAEFRIRGAMLDALRARDSLSRDMRRISTALKKANADLANQLGREPSEVEVAAHLGVSIEEVRTRQAKLSGWSVVGFDDAGPAFLEQTTDERAASPCDVAAERELFGQMIDHIEKLPPKMQQVLSLYYCEDLNLKEIGHVLGVTESRVCQLHGEATKLLRASLGESFYEEVAA